VFQVKIQSLNQTSCRPNDAVFGASVVGAAVATISMGGMTMVTAYLAVHGRIGSFELPRVLSTGAGLFFLLFAWLASRSWRAARRPTNWVMRVRGNEVLVKFRSYQNWPLSDDDPQVISLRRDEIEFVREAASTLITRNADGAAESGKQVALEIGLKNADLSALTSALAAEAARPGWGNQRGRTKWLDNPVRTTGDNVIRINWSGTSAAVRPGIQAALRELGHIAKVNDQRKDVQDFTVSALRKLGEQEQKSRLAELAVLDRIKAAGTARELYGCSLGEATQRVEDAVTRSIVH
jgi:hypothetical protein